MARRNISSKGKASLQIKTCKCYYCGNQISPEDEFCPYYSSTEKKIYWQDYKDSIGILMNHLH